MISGGKKDPRVLADPMMVMSSQCCTAVKKANVILEYISWDTSAEVGEILKYLLLVQTSFTATDFGCLLSVKDRVNFQQLQKSYEVILIL